jgi:hypothetical protein
VLHHVYPEKYSMCSHHIASLLYITGRDKAGTVPGYYLEYCRELELWGARFNLNVVQTEFALWTWYWRVNHGSSEERREHRRRFDRDPWAKKRRAEKIKDSLKVVDKLGFARFFLYTDDPNDPTLGAIIAWREFEARARELLYRRGHREAYDGSFTMGAGVIPLLRTELNIDYGPLWRSRNDVMHKNSVMPSDEARAVVDGVRRFVESSRGKLGPQ